MQLLAKSSVCPGIITIIWSLITSDTIIQDEEDQANEDDDPDDLLTELLNNPITYEACLTIMNDNKNQDFKKNSKPVQVELRQNADIFTQSNNNQKFMKKQIEMINVLKKRDVWTHNYQTGTNYELYRVPLKRNIF